MINQLLCNSTKCDFHSLDYLLSSKDNRPKIESPRFRDSAYPTVSKEKLYREQWGFHFTDFADRLSRTKFSWLQQAERSTTIKEIEPQQPQQTRSANRQVKSDPQGKKKPIRVFILSGQSNMEGKAKVDLLAYQSKTPAHEKEFGYLHKEGKWLERDDVWIKFLQRHGKLTVGYGSPKCIGPELEFGWVVGDYFDEPVLLIKTAWGGRSLYHDFRSPSAGFPDEKVLQQMLKDRQKKNPKYTMEELKQSFGFTYRDMIREIKETLANLSTLFPQYQNQGYQISGFIWFQGWNDMINEEYT